jgi:site-specific recombinase XerD
MQAWIDEIGANSKAAANRTVDVMRAVINWGIRQELIPVIPNPCTRVDRFRIASRERFIAPGEFTRIRAALDEEAPIMRDFFWLLLLTGARKGNMLAMRWSAIDLDLATWTIPADEHKNGKSHIVTLCELAMIILQRRKQAAGQSIWVFPGKVPGAHLQDAKRAWERVRSRAGIEDLRIHDLRRTLASYLAMSGENQYVIAKALGHADIRSTAIYARLDTQPVRAAVNSVSEKWQQMLAMPAALPLPRLEAIAPRPLTAPCPKNAGVRLSSAEQVIAEGKILSAITIRGGACTKKVFYQKIGAGLQINSAEMERVLNEMVDKGLIERYRDDAGQTRYRLAHGGRTA